MSGHQFNNNWYHGEIEKKDPGHLGTIEVGENGYVYMDLPNTTGGAETRTLASPSRPGLMLVLAMSDANGSTVTVNAAGTDDFENGGLDAILFNATGEMVQLTSVLIGSTYQWRVTGKQDATVS